MTLAVESRNDYIGTGLVDTYPYSFKIFADVDLEVTIRNTDDVESVLMVATDYAVTGVGSSSGGTIVLLTGALGDDLVLTIRRVVKLAQDTDLRNQEGFFSEVLEDQFDRQTMIDQQQQDEIDRSFRLPVSEIATPVLRTIPSDRAGKYLAFDNDGNPIALAGSAFDFRAIGRVRMIHSALGVWQVLKPDGSVLPTVGSTTMGLQEAINHAHANRFILEVDGGGLLATDTYNNHQITCTTPLVFPTGHNDSYHFHGCFLFYAVDDGGADPTKDFIIFNSTDTTEVNFHNCEIIYQGDAAAVRFLPSSDNGESFAGFTTSRFIFGTVGCLASIAHPVSIATCFRVSMPHLGLGLLSGDGLFAGNYIEISEINNGVEGFRVDVPGAGNNFSNNTIKVLTCHNISSIAVNVGVSAGAAGLIFGNNWDLNLFGSVCPASLSTWGGRADGGDFFRLTAQSAQYAVIFQPSAVNNTVVSGLLGGTVATILNSATEQSNKVIAPTGFNRTVVTVGASPFVYQNMSCVPVTALISAGTVSAIHQSHNGTTYDPTGLTSGSFVVWPGHYLKVTHTGAPTMIVQY